MERGETVAFAQNNYGSVQLVTPDDPEYVAFVRRMADRRPSRGGPRQAGEYLGGLVELCVRHWLAQQVPLQEARILTYEQRQRNGRQARLYRELDAVWPIDDVSLCLFEMKLTFPENMERGVGLFQLETATEILFASGRYEYILKRLVYVAETKVTVLEDLPELAPDDEFAELGVVWVAPEAVEAAAQELELELPDNWREPELREGRLQTTETEEWRQYAEPQEPENEAEPSNPLAEALRRAQQNKG